MISLILLAGLILLFAAYRQLNTRVRIIEQQVEHLNWLRLTAEHEAPAQSPALWPDPTEPKAAPAPELEVALEPSPPPAGETLSALFERFVAGRLLIWIGGISLAVAGVFLVRYSIEIGLVTPPVRMLIAGAFGLLLIGAGEAARSRSAPGDPRVEQALVGAGIFVLYATVYGSLTLYGLIGLGTASALMVAVTAAALALSLRHGAPTAVMGLAGGFLTPLLVGDPDSSAVPLLFYLALLNAALFAIAARRGWSWLAAAATVLSFAWTGFLLVGPNADDALASGVFIVALAIAASLARPGDGGPLRLIQPAAIGLVQLALLVGRADPGIGAWLLFGSLAVAVLALARREPRFRLLPSLALGLALILLAIETPGGAATTPAIAAAITALFAGHAWWRGAREDRALETLVACAAFAMPAIILRIGDPLLLPRPSWAGVMILLALGPIALAWRHRGAARPDGPPDWALFGSAATTLLLLGTAAYDIFQRDLLPAAWLAVAIGAAIAARRLDDRGIALLAFAGAGAAAIWIVQLVPDLWSELAGSLVGLPALATDLPPVRDAMLALLLPGILLLLLWRGLRPLDSELRTGFAVAAGLLLASALYIVFKQVFGLASDRDFVARGLAERTIITQALFLAGWVAAHRSSSLGTVLTALAAARLVWFELLLHNPLLIDQQVGSVPVLNLLLPAFLGSAFWLYAARARGGPLAQLWLGLFLAALVAGVMLIVRQGFQGTFLSGPETPRGEFYGYSLAGLLLAIGLLLAGTRLPDKPLRVAGLALLTATIFKVFLIDAAALAGVLRIVSFLGLGVALIGVGKLYAKVLSAEGTAAQA